VALAKGSDHLFIEAAFMEQDHEIAERKHHLTTQQAGCLAKAAKVKQMTVFHFSPRYTGMEEQLREEARAAYENSTHQRAKD
jgi:ribonuclease Z